MHTWTTASSHFFLGRFGWHALVKFSMYQFMYQFIVPIHCTNLVPIHVSSFECTQGKLPIHVSSFERTKRNLQMKEPMQCTFMSHEATSSMSHIILPYRSSEMATVYLVYCVYLMLSLLLASMESHYFTACIRLISGLCILGLVSPQTSS